MRFPRFALEESYNLTSGRKSNAQLPEPPVGSGREPAASRMTARRAQADARFV